MTTANMDTKDPIPLAGESDQEPEQVSSLVEGPATTHAKKRRGSKPPPPEIDEPNGTVWI